VLHEGSLAAAGMPQFDDLTEPEMRSIFMYIRQQARDAAQQAR
jgi:hypothetical protein